MANVKPLIILPLLCFVGIAISTKHSQKRASQNLQDRLWNENGNNYEWSTRRDEGNNLDRWELLSNRLNKENNICAPRPKVCHLPLKPGPCKAYRKQYGFDARKNKCVSFVYGGCVGTPNRFDTLEECSNACENTRCSAYRTSNQDLNDNEENQGYEQTDYINSRRYDQNQERSSNYQDDLSESLQKRQLPDICHLPPDGPCDAYMPRYYYDPMAKDCKQFIYGGCRSNGNNFKTKAECLQTCAPYGQSKRRRKRLYDTDRPNNLQQGPACTAYCSQSNQKFGYKNNFIYQYKYDANIDTRIDANNQASNSAPMMGHRIQADVDIRVLDQCQYQLWITNAHIAPLSDSSSSGDANRNKALERELQRNAILFNFDDGKIGKVCSATDDDPLAVNIKKGILNLFLNTMSRFDQNGEETITEEDTTGRCQTVYRAQQPTGQFKVRIQKSKDLSQCSHDRYDTQSVGYNPSVSHGGEANVLSLLKGKKECEQFMSHDNVLAKSQCREKLTLNGALGQETAKVVTDMYQTLDYVSHQRFDTNYNANYGKDENRDRNYPNQNLWMSIDAPQTRPQNIPMIESDLAASSSFYEERYSIKQSNTQATKDILYDMVQDTRDVGIQPESPHKFLRLVESVRTLSTQAIQDLYHELKSLAAKDAKKSNNYRNRNPNNNQNADDSARSPSRSSFRQNNENSKNRNRNSHGNSHAQWSVESIHEKAYKHYIDAIPMAQTLESIGAIVKLYESGAVTRGHAKYWIIALSFIPEPTIEMINALNPLMSAFSSDDSVTLAYSSLLNNLARTNPFYQDLQNVPEARELHNYIAQTLTHSCSGSSYAERKGEKAFAALKSLGNLGFSPNLIPHVVTCFQNQYVPHKLKVAAVESLRKMPCQAQKHLLDLFSQGNDAEIRMRAFLLIHQCPTPAALHEIRETLRHEANRDVATLVYSFYKNVNESTDPQKEKLRLMVGEMNMLGAIEPHVEQILNNANYYTDSNDANNNNNDGNQRQQSENPQHFSKYFEQSFHNDLVNSGFVSEGHIFYHQDRINSARLALKANVFGINYNLIDVALDLETTALLTNELNILAAQANSQSSQQNNLNQNALLNLLQLQSAQSSQQQNQLSNNIQRRKRQNAGQKNNNRSNRLEESLPEVGSKLISSLLKILTDPSLDKAQALGSLKLGGKEILFWDILGSDIQNIMSDPVSALQKLKQFSKYRETSFTESTLLADNSAIVTTGLGFPLNITIKSAAVTDIGIMGFVDMNNLVLNQEIQLKGTIKPSAAVYVQASVSLMGISLSGVGVSTLIHTNSELGIHMHYSLSSGMKYKLTLPDRKMDVLQIQNRVFSIASNGEIVDNTRLHSNEACTGPKVAKVFGLEACLSYQYPSALATGSAFKKEGQFPTGIFGAGITLEKIDPTIEHYEISVKSSKQDEAKYRVKVHVETPGSKNSHTTDLDGRFDLDQKTMKVDLKSELGIWDITGQYREESPKRTTTHLTFINGKQQVYDHKMAIEINENKDTWTEDIGFVYDITYPNKNAPAHYIFKMSSSLDNDLMKRPTAKNHPLSQYSRSFKGAIIRPNTFQATFEGSTVKSLTSYDLKFETEYSTKTLKNQRLFIKKYMQYDRKRVAHNMRYKSEMESTQFPALNHEIDISSQLDTTDHDGSLGNGLKNYQFYGHYSTNDDAKWSNITVSVRNDSSNHGSIADQNLHLDVKYDSSEDEKVNGNAIVKIHIERDNEAQNAQRSRNYANAQGHNPYDDDEDSIRQLKSHLDLHVDFNTKEYPDHKILGQFDFERIKMQGAYQNANSDRNSAYPGYETDEPKHKWYSRGQLQKFPRAQTSGANRSPGSNSRLNRRKNIWQKIVYSLNPNRPSESDENQYMAAIDTDNSNYLAYEILVTPLSHFRATIDFDFGEGPNYYKAEFVNTSPFRNSKNMTLLIEAYDKDQMEQNANGPSQAEHESQIAEIQTEQNALSEENVGKQRLYATYVRTPDSSAAKLNVHFVDNEGEVYDVFYKHQIYINEQNDDRNGLVMLTTTLPWDSVRNIDMLAQLSVRNKQLQGKLKYTQDDFKIMGNVVGTKSEKSIDAQFNATTSLESAKEIVFNVHSEKTESQWSHKTELLMYDQSHHEKRSSIKIIVQTDPRFKIVVKIQPTVGMPEMDLFISTENEAEIIFKIVSHQGSKFYFKTVLPPKLLELIDSNVDRNQYSQRARQNHRYSKQRSQLQQKTLYANQNNDYDFNLIEYIPVKVETSFKVILSTYTLSHGFVFINEPQHLYFNWNAQVSPVMARRIEWELDVKMNDRDISARTKLQLTRKTVVIELDHDDQRENDKLKSQTNMKFYPDHENIPTRFISFDSHANGILVSSGPNYGLRKKVVINISSIIADSLKVDKPIKTQTTLTLHDAETIVHYESEVIYDEGKSFLVKLNFKDASKLRLSRVIGDLRITKPNSKLDWKVRGNYETSVSKPYKKYNIDSSYLMDNGEIRKLDIDYISDPEKDLHKFNFQLDNSDLMAKVFINTKKPSYMVIIQTGDPHDPKDSHTSVINYNVNTKVFDVKFLDSLYLRAAIETDDKALVDLYILDPNVSAPKASDPNNWGQNLQDQLPAYSLVAILNNTRTVHLHSKWEKDAPDKVEKIMKKSGHRLSHLIENGVHHLIEDIIKKLRRSGVDIVTQASDTPIEQLNSLCKQIKQHIQNRYLQADPKSNNRRLYNNNANRQRHQMQSTNTNGAADILSAILEVFPDIAEDLSLLKHHTIRAIATQKSLKYKLQYLWNQILEIIKSFYSDINDLKQSVFKNEPNSVGQLLSSILNRSSQSSVQALLRRVQKAFSAANYQNNEESQFLSSLSKGVLPNHPLISMFAYAFANFKNAEPDLQQEPFEVFNDERRGAASRQINWDSIYNEERRFDGTDKLAEYAANNNYERLSQAPSQLRQQRQTDNDESSDLADENPIESARNAIFARKDYRDKMRQDEALVVNYLRLIALGVPLLTNMYWPQINVNTDMKDESQIDVTLPFKWESFKHMPDLEDFVGIKALVKILKTLKEGLGFGHYADRYDSWDFILNSEHQDPVKMHFGAALINSSSILSWDKNLYHVNQFPSSYILARDTNNQLHVVVSPRNPNKQNRQNQAAPRWSASASNENAIQIDIKIANKDVITVAQNGVFVNDIQVQFPTKHGNFEILAAVDRYIAYNEKDGYMLMYYIDDNTFVFTASQAHANQFSGLFGTNNGNFMDDFTTASGKNLHAKIDMASPNKESIHNLRTFINSWELNHYNRQHPKLPINLQPEARRTTKKLEAIYYSRHALQNVQYNAHDQRITKEFISDYSSELRNCHPIYTPDILQDVLDAAQAHGKQEGLCKTIQALTLECFAKNVHIELPKECVTCQVGNQLLKEDDAMPIQQMGAQERKIHIVYMIEEAYDVKETESDILRSVKELNNELKEKHSVDGRNIKYTVVGFGNPKYSAIQRYYSNKEGETTFEMDDFENVWKNIKFTDRTLPQPLDVIFLVSKEMDFAPNTIRVMQLISHRRPSHDKRIDSGSVFQALKDQSIMFNALVKCPLEYDEKTNYPIGFDRDSIFFAEHSNDNPILGDVKAYSHTRKCKGLIVDLAKRSDGVVFDHDSLRDRPSVKKSVGKDLTKVMTRVIAQKTKTLPAITNLIESQTYVCAKNALNDPRLLAPKDLAQESNKKSQHSFQDANESQLPNVKRFQDSQYRQSDRDFNLASDNNQRNWNQNSWQSSLNSQLRQQQRQQN